MRGYEVTRRVAPKGLLLGMTGASLGRDWGRWKEVSFFGEWRVAEEERMGSKERTMGRQVGVAGVRDSPPTSCSLGLRGRSGHRSDCHAGGDHGEVGGRLKKSLPSAPLTSLALPCSSSFRSQPCPSGGRNRCLPTTVFCSGWLWAGLLHKNQVSCREIDSLVFFLNSLPSFSRLSRSSLLPFLKKTNRKQKAK